MTSEPRTPSTPRSLAQLRDAILADHEQESVYFDGPPLALARIECRSCRQKWPCEAALLATLLSPENVAVGLRTILGPSDPYIEPYRRHAAALLEAIGASQ